MIYLSRSLMLFAMVLLCSLSCSRENSSSGSESSGHTTSAEQAVAPHNDQDSVADTLGSELIPAEAPSTDAVEDATRDHIVLPTNFGRRTGDLDEMVKARKIRALVVINRISFFYTNGKPKGTTYEMLEELQRVMNRRLKTGALKVRITFIPVRPDALGPALTDGVGDVIAQGLWITPKREEKYAFTAPIKTDVTQIIVTGQELANLRSFDDRRKRNLCQSINRRL